MDWKIVLSVLLCCMLVFSVCAGCSQQEEKPVEAVREMVKALPGVEEFKTLDAKAQQVVYLATQNAYDAYQALTEEQKAGLAGELAAMEALFAHYNSLIMPLAD